MSFEQETNCEDFARRFDGFLDGEMDAHSMRSMAMHAGRCAACGAEFERAEKLHGLLVHSVASEVDRIDTSGLWSAIEARLEPSHGGLRGRLRELVNRRHESRWFAPLPALALGGALAALVAVWVWPATAPSPTLVADNHAQIDRIDSSSPHVAVWSEPTEHTTAIWVASYDPEGTP